jgi:hypothetical protein
MHYWALFFLLREVIAPASGKIVSQFSYMRFDGLWFAVIRGPESDPWSTDAMIDSVYPSSESRSEDPGSRTDFRSSSDPFTKDQKHVPRQNVKTAIVAMKLIGEQISTLDRSVRFPSTAKFVVRAV